MLEYLGGEGEVEGSEKLSQWLRSEGIVRVKVKSIEVPN